MVVGPYVVLASLWILFSDWVVGLLAADAATVLRWSTLKGWGFVMGTAVLFGACLLARERVRQRNRSNLLALVGVIDQLAAARSRETVFEVLRLAARTLAGSDVSTVVLREGDSCHYCVEAGDEVLFKGRRFPIDRCVSGWVMTQRMEAVIRDVMKDARVPVEAYASTGIRSLALVPFGPEEPIGAIGVYWKHHHQASPEEMRLLRALADAAGIALEKLRSIASLEERIAERTRELEAALERAREADQIKSSFLATMSHELRTPLNSIIGFTGVILQGLAGPINEEQRRQLTMVRDSSRHLHALINDILDLSKIEARQLQPQMGEMPLREAVTEAVEALRPQAEAKGLGLNQEMRGALPETVWSDRRRFGQILYNLIGNAIKFTQKGRVDVLVEALPEGLALRISDTGPGIPEAEREKIFEAFRQLESVYTRTQEGTGLGLAISQRLATLLGGRLEVASAPGKGSTFTFWLPLPHPPPPSP